MSPRHGTPRPKLLVLLPRQGGKFLPRNLGPMEGTQPVRVRIGVFELHLTSGELRSSDEKIMLQEQQPLQVLRMLVEREGEIVTREEIQTSLYPLMPKIGKPVSSTSVAPVPSTKQAFSGIHGLHKRGHNREGWKL